MTKEKSTESLQEIIKRSKTTYDSPFSGTFEKYTEQKNIFEKILKRKI